jgi:hypothetical protein
MKFLIGLLIIIVGIVILGGLLGLLLAPGVKEKYEKLKNKKKELEDGGASVRQGRGEDIYDITYSDGTTAIMSWNSESRNWKFTTPQLNIRNTSRGD